MPGGFKHTVTIGESKKKSEESFTSTDQFGGELKYFSDCILRNKHPEADGEEGLLDVRIVAAVERALETGEPQKLEPYMRKRRPTTGQVQELHKVKEPELIGAHQPSQGR